MALLQDADRLSLWQLFMALLSRDRDTITISKADLRAAVNAADAWVNANKVSYNAALPLPARTSLTDAQKANLLILVVLRRYERNV